MTKVLCVTLDTLLDTRLSLLKRLKHKMTMLEYVTRLGDKYEGIDNIFKMYYSRRDNTLLNNAKPTRVFELIISTMTDINLTYSDNNEIVTIDLLIDVYPYVLTKKDEETVKSLITNHISNVNVGIIRREFSASYLDGIDFLIDYDGLDKINKLFMIIDERDIYRYITKTVIIPDIVNERGAIEKGGEEEFFTELMALIGQFINLQFLDKILFSVDIQKNKLMDTHTTD